MFKLTVSVRPEDALRPRDDLSLSSAGVDKEEEPATEIYVPLVHYAHNKYIPNAQNVDDEAAKGSVEVISDTPGGSRNVSTVNLLTLFPHLSATDLVPSIAVLDISVYVSEGRWSVEGQTLKWWYPIPKEGESEKEYTIEIKRKSGVIKAAAEEGADCCENMCPNDGCVM